MSTRTRFVTTSTLVSILLAPMALAAPVGGSIVDDPVTGRAYQVFTYSPGDNKTWEVARTFAATQQFEGRQGHLATITSAEENAFIAAGFDNNAGERWIGGFQPPGSVEPAGGWQWVNDEGSFDDKYTNWTILEGEPNDLGGIEDHAAIFLGGDTTWNDEGNLNNITGFIVEFRGADAAQNCLEGPDGVGGGFGCNLTGSQNVELPNEVVEKLVGGETIQQVFLSPDPAKVAAYVKPAVAAMCTGDFAFPDPRVNIYGRPVGKLRPLDVFDVLGGGTPGTLILDAMTYGSPCFAVIEGGANFELVDVLPDGKGGVASMTQIPESVDGIGPVLECYHPGSNPDLQQGTQFSYQASDLLDMVEKSSAPMTNSCNSPSRGATFKFSFYTLNTHEDCGIDYGSRFGPLKVQLCFKLRALEKGHALEQALRNARMTLASPVYNQMTRKLDKAQLLILLGAYPRAYDELLDFLDLVEDSTWDIDISNHPGNLNMRTLNMLYRVLTLQQAQDNLF